jgi:hypothetical protein
MGLKMARFVARTFPWVLDETPPVWVVASQVVSRKWKDGRELIVGRETRHPGILQHLGWQAVQSEPLT